MKAHTQRTRQTLALTDELREELKNPLGTLLTGAPAQTMKQLKQLIQREPPTHVISVGDMVTRNMMKSKIPVHIMIIDNKVLRQDIQPIQARTQKTFRVENPSGTMTPEAWIAVEKALEQNQTTKILVEGEEDLFTLIAVLLASENTMVVYGQPHVGVVAVRVTPQIKKKAQLVIDAMLPVVEKPKRNQPHSKSTTST